jgi:copper chaperone CopZ
VDAGTVSDAAVVGAVEDCGFDGSLISAADDAPPSRAPASAHTALALPPPRPLARAALEIDGMHCASCTGACERALQGTPGVSTASVGLLPPRADVSYDADVTGPRALIAALSDAGFEARLADRARPSADGTHKNEENLSPGAHTLDTHPCLTRAQCALPLNHSARG